MAKGQFLFDRILLNSVRQGRFPEKTRESLEWFREKASKVSETRNRFIRDAKKRQRSSVDVGKMYFFSYPSVKTKTLRYWDAYPLVIPFNEDAEHLYSLSMHHAPPKLRAIAMDSLYSTVTDERLTKKTRMALSWEIIKSLKQNKYMKPLVRNHLKNRIKSKFIEVEASEWNIALFLPYQQFLSEKSSISAQKVYSLYRKRVAKGG